MMMSPQFFIPLSESGMKDIDNRLQRTSLIYNYMNCGFIRDNVKLGNCFSGNSWVKFPGWRKPRSCWCPVLAHSLRIKHCLLEMGVTCRALKQDSSHTETSFLPSMYFSLNKELGSFSVIQLQSLSRLEDPSDTALLKSNLWLCLYFLLIISDVLFSQAAHTS